MDLENNKYLYINATKFNDLTYVFGHAHEGFLIMHGYIYEKDTANLIKIENKYIKMDHHGDVEVTEQKWANGENGKPMGNWEDVLMDCRKIS